MYSQVYNNIIKNQKYIYKKATELAQADIDIKTTSCRQKDSYDIPEDKIKKAMDLRARQRHAINILYNKRFNTEET